MISGLQTALLFSICFAKHLKIHGTKLRELNNLNRTIKLNNETTRRFLAKTTPDSKDEIKTRSSKTPITFMQRRLNNEDVKKSLNRVSMARQYGNSFSNYEFVPYSNNESVPISSVPNRRIIFETNGDHTTDFEKEYENEQIFEVLDRQAVLIEKLTEVLEIDNYALRSKNDFENLLSEIDLTKNSKKTTKAVKTTSTKAQDKKKLSTVMTVVDETEVRTALKKDPLVMRILKMANMKRLQYIKAAKKYYNS